MSISFWVRPLHFRPKAVLVQVLPSPNPILALPTKFFPPQALLALGSVHATNPLGFGRVEVGQMQFQWLVQKNPWLAPAFGERNTTFKQGIDARLGRAEENVFDPLRIHGLPPGIEITPYPFQVQMFGRALEKFRGVICAGVGSGKTIVVGLILAKLFEVCGAAQRPEFQALLLVPRALVGQWEKELVRIFPRTRVLHPPKLSFQGEVAVRSATEFTVATVRNPRSREWAWERSNANIIITNPEKARTTDIGRMTARFWHLVVIDEANIMRNPRSEIHKSVQGIRARFLYLLTATPAENGIQDFFGLAGIVDPDLFSPSFEVFANRYLFLDQFGNVDGVRHPFMPEFKRLSSQVIITARRGDVDAQLPRIVVEEVLLELDPGEKKLYDRIEDDEFVSGPDLAGLFQAEATVIDVLSHPDDEDFARLIRLEQFIDHPALITARVALEGGEGGEEGEGEEPEEGGEEEEGAPQPVIRGMAETLSGSKVGLTTKLRETLALVREILGAGGEKIIVFTRFAEMAKILHKALVGVGGVKTLVCYSQVKSDTGVSVEETMAFFETDATVQVLVSTDVLGRGWNAQFCHHLINYDMTWNPAIIIQRIGRVRRIGATARKHIYNIIVTDTLSERIYRVGQAKNRLIAATLDYNTP